jgi:hypothetical protein
MYWFYSALLDGYLQGSFTTWEKTRNHKIDHDKIKRTNILLINLSIVHPPWYYLLGRMNASYSLSFILILCTYLRLCLPYTILFHSFQVLNAIFDPSISCLNTHLITLHPSPSVCSTHEKCMELWCWAFKLLRCYTEVRRKNVSWTVTSISWY